MIRAGGKRGGLVLSDQVICYLFFGGAGAGAVLLLLILDLLSPQASDEGFDGSEKRYCPQPSYRRFFAPGFTVALVALILGAVFLMADLGRIDRVAVLFMHPTFSYISIGTYTLTALILATGFLAAVWSLREFHPTKLFMRIVEVVAAMLACVVMGYTGMLLQGIQAIAFWTSPFVPVIFVLSSLSTGLALIVCTMYLTGSMEMFEATIARLVNVDIVIILVEAVCVTVFLVLSSQDARTMVSVEMLLEGSYAAVFWGGFVVSGLLLPLALDLVLFGKMQKSAVIACLLVLIGGFCLRWCIVMAGIPPDALASAAAGLGL